MRSSAFRVRGSAIYATFRFEGRRVETRLRAASTCDEAAEIASWIWTLVDRLIHGDRLELARQTIRDAAALRSRRGRKALERSISEILRTRKPTKVLFRDFAERWTSGELARTYPDHVRTMTRGSAMGNRARLEAYVLPVLGSLPLDVIRLEDADRVMRALPSDLAPASRRHVAQLLHRILRLAVFPARLIDASPLPPGFLPALGKSRAKGFLYPSEDRALVSCAELPRAHRLAFGVLVREGARVDEILSSEWWQWGDKVFTLDKNKTADPRLWVIRPDVARAMARWRLERPDRPFAFALREKKLLAQSLRDALRTAGVTRAELFERSATRQPIRAHDLRATFVTLALAGGQTEQWVCDRTGHRSSDMINRYRRQARHVAELGMGYADLVDLDAALWPDGGDL